MPYQIIKRTPKDFVGIQMGKKQGAFGSTNIIKTNDASLARDIRQRFGQERTDGAEADVLVARVPDKTTGNLFPVGIQFDKKGIRI